MLAVFPVGLVGDFSLHPQPIGWSVSRASLLLKKRTKDRVDELRQAGVVSTMQQRGAMSLVKALGDSWLH